MGLSEVVGAQSWAYLTSGDAHACALDNLQRTWCWGRNQFGQINGSFNNQNEPVLLNVPAEPLTDAAAGGNQTCLLYDSGFLECRGENQVAPWAMPPIWRVKGRFEWRHRPEPSPCAFIPDI